MRDSIRITELWEHRRIVLCFLRHFGCAFCKQMVAGLNQLILRLKGHGVPVVAIGIGNVEQARQFLATSKFNGELYVDGNPQDPQTFRLFKLLSGPAVIKTPDGTILEAVIKASAEAEADGFKNEPPEGWTGSVFHIGGTFVLGCGNSCDFVHRSQHAGDHPDLEAVATAAIGRTLDGQQITYPTTQAWINRLETGKRKNVQHAISKDGHISKLLPRMSTQSLALSNTHVGGCVLLASIYFSLRHLSIHFAAVGIVLISIMLDMMLTFRKRRKRDTLHDIRIITPRQIDTIVLEKGMIECDCGFIESSTDATSIRQGSTVDVFGPAFSNADLINSDGSLPENMSVADVDEYQKAVCYFREFLAKGHNDLGREGPTCPFVPTALRKNTLYMAVCRPNGGQPTTREYVEKIVLEFLNRFAALKPVGGRIEIYKAILMIFPGVPLSRASEIIDAVQAKLKPLFVRRGLMLGEFHMYNDTPGLRNPNFYPLRTPTPCLAIRKIVPTDLAFLDMSKYSADTRVEFLQSYLKQFEIDKLKGGDRKSFEEARLALERAKKEL